MNRTCAAVHRASETFYAAISRLVSTSAVYGAAGQARVRRAATHRSARLQTAKRFPPPRFLLRRRRRPNQSIMHGASGRQPKSAAVPDPLSLNKRTPVDPHLTFTELGKRNAILITWRHMDKNTVGVRGRGS
jgi:hypothetical protein